MDDAPQQTALVTGSARRLGRLLAAGLIEAGWRVVVHARSDADARLAAAELGAAGWVAGDIADPDVPPRLVEQALAQLDGGLDLLVNSASGFLRAGPLETDAAAFFAEFSVTVRGALLMTRAAHPALHAAGGCVVNLSDRSAREHWTTRAAHSAAKAALESLTLSCAKAFAPRVRVCALAPGNVLAPDDQPDMVVDTPPGLVLAELLAIAADGGRTAEIVTW